MLASSKDQISFTVEVSDLEFRFQDDVSDENPEKYCRDWYLDYTQSVSCRLRIAKTGGLKTIHLGSIPKQTQEENFIINGKERSVIAQLVKSPGLTFHRGELLRKYTGSDGSCAVTK
jgi:DNA-directed RNA polymerase beta subunit